MTQIEKKKKCINCQTEFPYFEHSEYCLSCRGVKSMTEIKEEWEKVNLDPNEDPLQDYIRMKSKTVKDDIPFIYHILFNGLSIFTPYPTNLMAMEKSGEGKTYTVLQIAGDFPKKYLIILSNATPQSFKYQAGGILVNDNFDPIQGIIDDLNEKIEEAKKQKQDIAILERQKLSLIQNSMTLFDLREKWIIFKEPPHPKLLEALYSILSKDEEYSKFQFVNKNNAGKNQSQTVVFQGSPAMVICTARDETKHERFEETFSRFELTSPNISKKKYSEGLVLIGQKLGLPNTLYSKHVLSINDKQHMKVLILKLIKSIKTCNGEVINPFVEEMAKQFPQDAGYRFRQFQRFNMMINFHCWCYFLKRPHVVINDRKCPMVSLEDISWANEIMRDNDTLPPHKLRWFKDWFVPCYKENNNQPIRISDIAQYVQRHGVKTTTRQIRQVYLDTLFEYGYVEKEQDHDNKSRDVYWTNFTNVSTIKSPLDSISSLDIHCVKSFFDKYLEGNFRYELQNKPITKDEAISLVVSVSDSSKTLNFETKNSTGILESSGIQWNSMDFTRDPPSDTNSESYWTCFTCNERGSGPWSSRKDPTIINQLKQCRRLNHNIKNLTVEEYEDELRRQRSIL